MTAVKQANPYSDQLHGDLYDRERREMLGLGGGAVGGGGVETKTEKERDIGAEGRGTEGETNSQTEKSNEKLAAKKKIKNKININKSPPSSLLPSPHNFYSYN